MEITQQLQRIEQELAIMRQELMNLQRHVWPIQTGLAYRLKKALQRRNKMNVWDATRGSMSPERAELFLRFIEKGRQMPDRGPLPPDSDK